MLQTLKLNSKNLANKEKESLVGLTPTKRGNGNKTFEAKKKKLIYFPRLFDTLNDHLHIQPFSNVCHQ